MRYLLPYAFARSQQLLLEDHDGQLTLWLGEGSGRQGLGEVLRQHGRGQHKVQLVTLPHPGRPRWRQRHPHRAL